MTNCDICFVTLALFKLISQTPPHRPSQIKKQPTKVLRSAVIGMINKTKLRHSYMEKRLHIYPGEEHPHKEVEGMRPLPRVPHSRVGTFGFGLNHP